MSEHFNGLTPAEAERLAMLSEECAEVIQIIGKIMRHGYGSCHPESPGFTNRESLEEEVGDVHAVLHMMREAGDCEFPETSIWIAGRVRRKMEYAHHQTGE